jgi:hypothetical protein
VSCPVLRRRARPVTLTRSVCLLACDFEVRLDSAPLARWLDARLPDAHQDFPISVRARLAVTEAEDEYEIRMDDGVPHRVRGLDPAGETVLALLNRRALAALGGYTKVHAGCARWQGRRFLVVGAPQAGKSTLMAWLLCEGAEVEGDELVVVRDGQATAYPRLLGIRAGSIPLVPGLVAAGRATGDGFYLSPAALGKPWRIGPGPVDAVFVLEVNHSRPTRVEPCPRYLMVQRVMAQSEAPTGGGGRWIREVSTIVDRARCQTLYVGGLDGASAAVRQGLGIREQAAATLTRAR